MRGWVGQAKIYTPPLPGGGERVPPGQRLPPQLTMQHNNMAGAPMHNERRHLVTQEGVTRLRILIRTVVWRPNRIDTDLTLCKHAMKELTFSVFFAK
jgi:hypothetical protein